MAKYLSHTHTQPHTSPHPVSLLVFLRLLGPFLQAFWVVLQARLVDQPPHTHTQPQANLTPPLLFRSPLPFVSLSRPFSPLEFQSSESCTCFPSFLVSLSRSSVRC